MLQEQCISIGEVRSMDYKLVKTEVVKKGEKADIILVDGNDVVYFKIKEE